MKSLLFAVGLMLAACIPAFAQNAPAADLIVTMDLARGTSSTPAGFTIKYVGTDQSVIDCLAIAKPGTPENSRFSLALIEIATASLAVKEGGSAIISCDAVEMIPTPVSAVAPILIFPPALE